MLRKSTKCKQASGNETKITDIVGGNRKKMDNERLKDLLTNAIIYIGDLYYCDYETDETYETIKLELGITDDELKELGFDIFDEPAQDTEMQAFWEDFNTAEKFGVSSIKARFDLAFDKYKDNVAVMTNLSNVLCTKAYEQKTRNHAFADLYNELWQKVDDYATQHYKGEQLDNYLKLTEA